MPRAFTEEEVRNKLLDHVWAMVRYWENESRMPTTREKLEGLAFSMLSMLDGSTGDLPKFIVAPNPTGKSAELPKFIIAPDPHPSDAAYLQDQGENYFPENHQNVVACDLGGSLHELFYGRRPQ